LAAGADAKSAPAMQLNHLYEFKLPAQEQVSFAVTPGEEKPTRGIPRRFGDFSKF